MRSLLALALFSTGCFDHARIAATELPKLNVADLSTHDVSVMQYSPISGQVSMGTAAAIDHESAIDVRTIDGGTETIHGVPDVTVITSRGRWSFDGKWRAEIDGAELSMTAPNRSGRIPLVDIRYADVHSVATRKTILAIGGISLAVLVPVIIVAVAVH